MNSGFLVIVFLTSAFAACPSIDTVAHLDLHKYMGNWHVHAIVNTSQPIGDLKDYTNTLSMEHTEHLKMEPITLNAHLMYIDPTGEMPMTNIAISVDYPTTAPGYWTWNETGVISTAFVMFTDYVDFSLLLICRGDHETDHLEAHFMARSASPIPAGVVDNFKGRLSGYGIDVSSYRQVGKSHNMDGGNGSDRNTAFYLTLGICLLSVIFNR